MSASHVSWKDANADKALLNPSAAHTSPSSDTSSVTLVPTEPVNPECIVFKRHLSGGAQGDVFLAQDLQTMQYMAVKVTQKRGHTSGMIRDVLNEKAALQRAEESGWSLRLTASWHDTVNLYMATPYHAGGDLHSLLRHMGALPLHMAREFAAQLIIMTERLHSLGVIHRDIKPGNLLIDGRGHLVLADFGLAHCFCEAPKTEDLDAAPHPEENPPVDMTFYTSRSCGTPAYMAPEMRGDWYSFGVDRYAVGFVLYEMLTGEVPFHEPSEKGCMAYSDEEPVARPSNLVDFLADVRLDAYSRDLIGKLLCKNPSDRIPLRDIKNHPFFNIIDWTSIASKTQEGPYIPLLETPRSTGSDLWVPFGPLYDCEADPYPDYNHNVDTSPAEKDDACVSSIPSSAEPGSHCAPTGDTLADVKRLGRCRQSDNGSAVRSQSKISEREEMRRIALSAKPPSRDTKKSPSQASRHFMVSTGGWQKLKGKLGHLRSMRDVTALEYKL